MKRSAVVMVAIALVLGGCGRRKRVAAPAPARIGAQEMGLASWYGHPYHGRATSSGEIYDMEKLTAAHRTLPFGTMVRVKNLDNGKSVDVRINDRGPFVKGRIIDLSRAAARKIAMLGPGTARVRIQVVGQAETAEAEKSPEEGYFAVQIGAFRERSNAERMRAKMQKQYGSARLLARAEDPGLWRVLVGREATEEEAAALAERILSDGNDGFVVRVEAGE
jgi:rare lipoprotein A